MKNNFEPIKTILEDELQKGWIFAKIGELIDKQGIFNDGDWVVSKDQDPNGDVRLIQLADIGDGEYVNKSSKFLKSQKALALGCTFLKNGDVLIARMPEPLGRACIFPGDKKKSITAVDVCIVRPNCTDIHNKWLMYFVNAPCFRAAVASLQSGSTRKRISRKNLGRISLPLPPTNEQKRIVAEIEKQFSRLDEAVENLKRVKANLKRYKAAVLKAAVEGKLTEEWRVENPDVEPASELLERILTERRKKWAEAELAKMKAKGKESKDDKWKKKYKEPRPPEMKDSLSLPFGWSWFSTDQIFWFVTSGSRGWAKYYSETGPLFLRIGNLENDSISVDLKDVQKVQPPKAAEGRRTRVEAGDVLISITADIGMIALVSDDLEEAYINQHIALARYVGIGNPAYIAWYLASKPGQKQLGNLQRGVTKAGLGLNDIRAVNLLFPPISEQDEIVSLLESRLSIIREMEKEININLSKVINLRHAILTKAFSGRLIPQNPNDEPAEHLLLRIKAEREREEAESKKARQKGKKMKPQKKQNAKEKRNLMDVLRETNGTLSPEELFRLAGYRPEEVENFFAELKKADQEGLVFQEKKKNGDVLLRAVL